MKINKKALELIEKGLSSKTVSKLDESQINILHLRLMGEQVTEVPAKKTYKVGPKGGKIGDVNISQDPNTKEVMVTAEQDDLENNDALGADAMQSATGQETPHMSDDMAPDGMDDDSDNNRKEMGESKKTKDGPNPWAICHSQVGPKKSRKWERCVREVKKQLAEGKNPVSLFIENQIMRIVEKNLPPRITKGDLIKHLSESENFATKHLQSFDKTSNTETAPAKPKTKPSTKPGTKPQRPAHPGKNPNPGENPAPKAKKETKENSPSVAPSKPKTKPTTKPGTKPQRPAHPGKNPNPGENPAPKAKKPSAEEAKNKIMDVILNLLQN
jgi:hypothetical protein